MDSDKRSAQVERLEVVDTGRRRRWSEDEKLKIVLESLQAPRQVAATARRYGVSRSLLLRWRRSSRPEPKEARTRRPVVPVPRSPDSRQTKLHRGNRRLGARPQCQPHHGKLALHTCQLLASN